MRPPEAGAPRTPAAARTGPTAGPTGLTRRGLLRDAGRLLPALLAAPTLTGGLLAPRAAPAQGTPPPSAPPGAPRPQPGPPFATPPTPASPGIPAPRAVLEELQAALRLGIERFQAKDLAGVLTLVSDRYWTGVFTKRTVQLQLQAMFQVYQALHTKVAIDEVRLVGEQAWVYTTGEVAGQLPVLGQWQPLFVWDRQLEVARRENGAWRLYGYQQ